MLKIKLGITNDTIIDVEGNFDIDFDPDWFNDPLVKEMVKDVDKSEVISSYCIESPVFGQISPTMLSGGVKALIFMLKTDYPIWATACGDNCSKWILRIAEERAKIGKDLTIYLEHLMKFPDEMEAVMINTGNKVNSFNEFISEVLNYGYQSEDA